VTLDLGLVSVNGGAVNGAALNGTANSLSFSLEPLNAPGGVFSIDDNSLVTVSTVGSNLSFVVARGAGTSGAFSVVYVITSSVLTIVDPNNGLLAFDDGQANGSINIQIVDSGFPLLNQSFSLELQGVVATNPDQANVTENGPYIASQASAFVAVLPSHDPYGRFGFTAAANVTVAESIGTFAVSVQRTSGLIGAVSLAFTVEGTAKLGTDFRLLPSQGALSFASQQSSAAFLVTIVNDPTPSIEKSFTIRLTGTSPAIVPNGGDAIPIDVAVAQVTIEANNNVFGQFAFATLRYTTYSEVSGNIDISVLRTQSTIGM
jgi:hypothetical protein